MQKSASDYLSQLKALLPYGLAWTRRPDSNLARLLAWFADSFARLHARIMRIHEEADPRTTTEMLGDFERLAGLPDPCFDETATTLSERRDVVVAKLTSRGGQSVGYFTAWAERLGYKVEIEEFRPFVTGTSRCGEQLNGGHSVRFYWRVRVLEPRYVPFRTGISRGGDLLGKIVHAEDLECVLNRLKPAHTQLIFNYDYQGG